jgi:hypothetical protein
VPPATANQRFAVIFSKYFDFYPYIKAEVRIPPGMDPNFFVQKGFKFFTMPWGPWATAGIQNGLSGIKR